MAVRKVYSRTRPARWPAPAGTNVTVEAGVDGDVVSITWERDDLKAAGDLTTHIALRREEFDAIVDARAGRTVTATVGAVAPQKRGLLTNTDRARIVAAIEARKAADEQSARAYRELRDAIAAAAEHGASVRVMAEDLGVSTNTISRWKRGE